MANFLKIGSIELRDQPLGEVRSEPRIWFKVKLWSEGSLVMRESMTGAWISVRSLLLSNVLPPISTATKHAAAAANSLQSCPTLCDPIDGSPPGSPIPGILQARTLEWAAISFSNAWKGKVKVKSLSRARLLATPWTAAYQAPPSMGFFRQEYWSGVPLPSPDDMVR